MNSIVKGIVAWLIFIAITMTVAVSCDCGCTSEIVEAPPETALMVSQTLYKVQGGYDDRGEMREYWLSVRKWKFEGHDYLEFDGWKSGWEHNPNCEACQGSPRSSASSDVSEYEKLFGEVSK